MAENLPVEKAKEFQKALQDIMKTYIDIDKQNRLIYAALARQGQAARGEAAIRKNVLRDYATQLASIRELEKINKRVAKIEQERVDNLIDLDVQLAKQRSAMEDIVELAEKQRKIEDNSVKQMALKGNLLGAFLKQKALDAKRAFQTEGGKYTTQTVATGLAKTAVKAQEVAEDPKAAIRSMGIWGMLIAMIADVIDGVRNLGADLHKAAAESGGFAQGAAKARQESMNLYNNQISLMTDFGLTVKEAAQIYTDLKNTGIATLGVIPQTGDAMTNLALDVMSFAKATNQSTAQVSDQYAQLVRSFGMNKNNLQALSSTYNKIFSAASKAAHAGTAKVSEYMQTVMSLGETFKEVGINIRDVNKIANSVSNTLVKLGRPGGIDQINKIASGILGITEASEGWKVMMASMSGKQGGYAELLFQQEQRGEGFTLPGAGKFDAGQMIQSFKSMIDTTTGGMADPATQQLMIEKMGQQVGMDKATTQVMQQFMRGGLDEAEATQSLNQLHEQAIENNLSSKGMFDILKEILLGMIAKPILFIWKILAWWRNDTKSKEMAAQMEKKLNKVSGPETEDGNVGRMSKHAIGGDVKRSGMAMVHAGNTIVPVAKVEPYKDRMRGMGMGNPNFNFNIMIDERGLHNKFVQMEKQTLELLHKQQQGNFA